MFLRVNSFCLGHLWGRCANGTEGLGCAPPETFKNCADVSITAGTPEPADISSLQQNEVVPETTRKPSTTTTFRTPNNPRRNQSRPFSTTTHRTTTTTWKTTSRRTTQFGLGPYQYAPFRPNAPPAQLINPIRYK